MRRSRSFQPAAPELLEDRISTSGFPVYESLPLNSFKNGLGGVLQGSMIALTDAQEEGFRFGWGGRQLASGTVVVASSNHNPRVYLMKANSLTVWDFRLGHPFLHVFTSRDVADGSLARTAIADGWPWAGQIVDHTTIVPKINLPLTGETSGSYVVTTGSQVGALNIELGTKALGAANETGIVPQRGVVSPLGAVRVNGTLTVNPSVDSGRIQGVLEVRSTAGSVKLDVNGPSLAVSNSNSFTEDATYQIESGSGTIRFAHGSGTISFDFGPQTPSTGSQVAAQPGETGTASVRFTGAGAGPAHAFSSHPLA